MARRLRDPQTNEVVRVELSAEEMADALGVFPDQLVEWRTCVPPIRDSAHEGVVYAFKTPEEFTLYKKRAALLHTQMSEKAVMNVEKAGLLDGYAALAEDCPRGLTAHVWRSYGLVVLMQSRYHKKIDAEELALRASLRMINPRTGKAVPNVYMAEKHIRLLQALGYLVSRERGQKDSAGVVLTEARWEHRGLPQSWRGE